MPDLSHEAVHRFWSEYQDPTVYRVIAFMEGVENWTLDGHPDVEAALAELGKELDDISNIEMSELGHETLFMRIASHIKTGRSLKLLQSIDAVHPGSASKVLMKAEELSESSDDPPGLLLRRNIVFERLRLLSRIFAKERLATIVRALEGEM